jgi:four helix bundle protein
MGEIKKYRTGSHEKLIAWQMADKLDKMVQEEILPNIPRNEYKTKSQIDDASDSVGSNIVEGYYSGSTNEYVRFLRYSRRSCGELQERVRRAVRKGYINEDLFGRFKEVNIKTGYIIDRLIQSLERKIEGEKK